jgi:release factor glutamine methyltransferase
MKLYVNETVLIPRPETEELVALIVKETTQNSGLKIKNLILDIGTGSGCIAIALKKEMKNAEVFAIDISTEALKVAKQNADQQIIEVSYLQFDFLDESKRKITCI